MNRSIFRSDQSRADYITFVINSIRSDLRSLDEHDQKSWMCTIIDSLLGADIEVDKMIVIKELVDKHYKNKED